MTYTTQIFFQTDDPPPVVMHKLGNLWGVKFTMDDEWAGELWRAKALNLKITLNFEHGMEDDPQLHFSKYSHALLLYPDWKRVAGEDLFLDSVAIFIATQIFENFAWPTMATSDVQAILKKLP